MSVIRGPITKYLLVSSGKLVCCLFLGMKQKLSVVSNMLYRGIKVIVIFFFVTGIALHVNVSISVSTLLSDKSIECVRCWRFHLCMAVEWNKTEKVIFMITFKLMSNYVS